MFADRAVGDSELLKRRLQSRLVRRILGIGLFYIGVSLFHIRSEQVLQEPTVAFAFSHGSFHLEISKRGCRRLKARSVTSRSQEMKRPATARRQKVDEYCRSYLEVYPEICRLLAQLPESIDLRSFFQSADSIAGVVELGSMTKVFEQLKEITRQHPELRATKSIHLKPEFVQMMEEVPWLKGLVAVGEQEYPAWFARILGPMQQLALFLRLTPEMKMAGYFFLASYYANLKDLFGTMRRMQYGAEPLDAAKVLTLAG
jgi:hypothetical protein